MDKDPCTMTLLYRPTATPSESKKQIKHAATHRIPPHSTREKRIPQSWGCKKLVMESPRDTQIRADSLRPAATTNTTRHPTRASAARPPPKAALPFQGSAQKTFLKFCHLNEPIPFTFKNVNFLKLCFRF